MSVAAERLGRTRIHVRGPEDVWAQVEQRGPDECWPWLGSVTLDRRGRVRWRRRERYAYRVTWEIANGVEFPDHLHARHSCDNANCVNPAHITPGTPKENSRDAVERGRNYVPRLSGDELWNAHPSSLVEQVRADYATGRYTKAELAERHWLSFSTIDKWTKGEVRGLTPIRVRSGRFESTNPECGTRAMVSVHRKRGEPVCDACKEADREYMRQWKANRLRPQ